jgi:hypothetical protein
MSDGQTRLEQEAAFARSFAPLVENERRKFDVIDLRSTRENLRLAEERNIQLEVAMRDVLKALAQYGLTTETYCKPNGWRDLVDAHLVQLNALETRLDRVTRKLRSLENKNREAAEKTRADKLAAQLKAKALHERQKLRDETRLERLAALRRKSSNAAASADQRALRDGRPSKIHAAPGDALGNARRSLRAASR